MPIKQPLEKQQKEQTKVLVREVPNEQEKEPKKEQQYDHSETKQLKKDIKVAAGKLGKFPVDERNTILTEVGNYVLTCVCLFVVTCVQMLSLYKIGFNNYS